MRTQTPLDAATVESLLAAAVAAPSIHNTQPWRFRLAPDSRLLEVHSVPERTLPLTDPTHRAQYLSAGAAVFNLRLAAVHLGWRPEVRLLPDPHAPGLLAAVRLTGPLGADDQPPDPGLYEAIPRRHTSRMPFTGRPVPEPIVAEMVTAA
ncbi:nitroreductase family protein [Streptomyces tailanensis]|uniref:nitroreductase family protein n=1 Tax=Streptomyces tailanensis TaxID=2569858 RepID=UPI00319E5A54